MSQTAPSGLWYKSARSSSNAACVEVRFGAGVGIRDSKDRKGPTLDVRIATWRAFVAHLKTGAYDPS